MRETTARRMVASTATAPRMTDEELIAVYRDGVIEACVAAAPDDLREITRHSVASYLKTVSVSAVGLRAVFDAASLSTR